MQQLQRKSSFKLSNSEFTVHDSSMSVIEGDFFLIGTRRYGSIVVERKFIDSDSSI